MIYELFLVSAIYWGGLSLILVWLTKQVTALQKELRNFEKATS